MKLSFRLDQDEMRAALAKLDVLRRAYPDAADAAGFWIMTEIITAAQARVPVLSGVLRDSTFVTRTRIVKGGFSAPWASVVHELPPNVRRHTNGEWKFLSKVLNESYPVLLQRWARITERYALNGTGLADVTAVHREKPLDLRFGSFSGARTNRIRLRPKGREAFRMSGNRKRASGRSRTSGRRR